MNLVLKTPDRVPYRNGKDFSVVICCDGVTGERAGAVMDLLKKNLKLEEGRLLYQLWTIETLNCLELQALASVEMAKADMVIIGLRKGLQVFDSVIAWMNRMINLRRGRPGALVAVLEAELNHSDTAPEMLSRLKELATLGHMDFFATGGARVGRDAVAVRGVGEAARQFVLARNIGAWNGLAGGERMPAQTRGAYWQTRTP